MSYRGKKISIYFPCRNEENHLSDIIQKVPSFVDEIIIISNASTDNTVDRARELGLKVFEDNRKLNGIGYGFAHMTGMKYATGDIIITADGDGTYPVDQSAKMIDLILSDKYDFISGSRYPLIDGTTIPFKLRLGVGTLNWEARLLYGYPFKDILSGMWVFSREARDNLNLEMGDWNMSPEIKIKAVQNPKVRFYEYPIPQNNRFGITKQNHLQTGFSHLFWILKYRFKSFFE
jgi:glycosyltransferase involved in cell wall biosynthesis